MPAAAPASLVPLPDLPLEDVCRHREVGVLKTAISAWPCLTFLHSGFSNSRQVSLEALSGAGLVQKHRSNVLPEITHCHVPAVCTALVSYGYQGCWVPLVLTWGWLFVAPRDCRATHLLET